MKIILLSHERELSKTSNTGQLALDLFAGLLERVVWSRVNPDAGLLELLEQAKTVLIYPDDSSADKGTDNMHGKHTPPRTAVNIADFDNMIIIDSTWQEARKIYNRSPYLKAAPKASLKSKRPSAYTLRRNQREGGLCTAECVIELFRQKGLVAQADELEAVFVEFNTRS
jgi:DTW domain-containing protein YfiP